MELKIKLLNEMAMIPTYGSADAACFDLYATEGGTVMPNDSRVFGTGFAVEVEPEYVLAVYSRSGHGFKHGIRLGNGTGLIDADYRNEVFVCLHNDSAYPYHVESGERIAQARIERAERVAFVIVDDLSDTARGMNGIGSTGK